MMDDNYTGPWRVVWVFQSAGVFVGRKEHGVEIFDHQADAWDQMDYIESHGGTWWLYYKNESGIWTEIH